MSLLFFSPTVCQHLLLSTSMHACVVPAESLLPAKLTQQQSDGQETDQRH